MQTLGEAEHVIVDLVKEHGFYINDDNICTVEKKHTFCNLCTFDGDRYLYNLLRL